MHHVTSVIYEHKCQIANIYASKLNKDFSDHYQQLISERIEEAGSAFINPQIMIKDMRIVRFHQEQRNISEISKIVMIYMHIPIMVYVKRFAYKEETGMID